MLPLSQVFPRSPKVFSGEGLKAVAGRASQQARWKRFPSVLTEARMLQVGCRRCSLNGSRMELCRGWLIFILRFSKCCAHSWYSRPSAAAVGHVMMLRANLSYLTQSPKGPSK